MTEGMHLDEFLGHIHKGVIPPMHPIGTTENGWDDARWRNADFADWSTQSFQARDECIRYGMYAIVERTWTDILANWIGGRKCLEIMAGCGWLSKALSLCKTDVIATDDLSWRESKYKEANNVFPIEKIDAIDAVTKYYNQVEVLLVSWPPYEDETITNVAKLWQGRPLIYIGEGDGGCNAPDSFFAGFQEDSHAPEIQSLYIRGRGT